MKRLLKITTLLGLLIVIAACEPSGDLLTSTSALRTPTPVSLFQSPLSTPTAAPLVVPTTTSIPTATPMVVPPPPNWPIGEPWPPKSTTPIPTAPLPTRSPVPTPLGPRPAQLQALYYMADNNGTPELHVIGIDKQGRKWLETNVSNMPPAQGYTLHASPDGKYLAIDFAYEGLHVLELSSGRIWCPLKNQREECNGYFGGWLLDDRLLLRPSGGFPIDAKAVPGGVLVMNILTGQYEQLDLPVQPQFGYSLVQRVSLSPDRSKLAYSISYPENQKEINEIWVMRLDSKDKQLVRRLEAAINTLGWSPTDDQLLYLSQPGTNPAQTDPTELWLLNSDGKGAKLLAGNLRNSGNQNYEPAWSPDGRHVAFVKADNTALFLSDPRGPGTNVNVVDTVTGQSVGLSTFEGHRNDSLTWSPDGKFVAFVSSSFSIDPLGETPEHMEVWIASIDGKQIHALAEKARWPGTLAWLPSMPPAQEK